MTHIGKTERTTQNRVIALFQDELHYRFLGDWSDRMGNSNVEDKLLGENLSKRGYTPEQISRAVYLLRAEADNPNRDLYGNNKAVYTLLRYGVGVKIEAGKNTETVHLIDWKKPEKNDFALAEEVTLHGDYTRRPDLVLYLNGIAIGVIELKNSRVSIGDGIRQNLSNQQPQFHARFFSTIQLVFAGNDSEGLKYGAIGTEEKYFLNWKEDEEDNSHFKLDKYLLKMCAKDRLLELIHDFVLFDGGKKKLPRAHQYFGIKATQPAMLKRQGGIIWHTQGSGKSIVMVLLAKWLLENNPHARVVVITDRDELDKQIEGVFQEAGETITRTESGKNLMNLLGTPTPRILCSLIHKFGKKEVDNFEQFIQELESQPSHAVGEIFVFVDECHRTNTGKLHRVMKAIMPNAVFIGFTGTPLLKADRQTSLEVFGGYLHTYKFDEAVKDGVVLDLVYEARDIDQNLTSQAGVDEWFDLVATDLNDWQQDELKKKWGTYQRVQSSEPRMKRVVHDIVKDFRKRPRLSNSRGTAMLVSSSIYEACKYYELFQRTEFKGRCAIITSYNPQTRDITTEDTGANTETDKEFIFNLYSTVLREVVSKPGKSKTETYEDAAKDRFKREPANMRLLIVVDKLLTGFDAPSCTYLYIDKEMRDHGLFQAICRTNRLDGEDKDFGYIVDYKDLFTRLDNAIGVYTSELDSPTGTETDPNILLKERLTRGREKLEIARETLALLCEPVEPPKRELEHIHYFCGNTELPEDLKAHEPQRVALYKATVSLLRAYANLTDELESAGYSVPEVARIKREAKEAVDLREIIRRASGETLDLKAYEADMRHLIDTYIQAGEPRKISPFDDLSLLQLILKRGIKDTAGELKDQMKGNEGAVAEIIENNVRSKIIKEHLSDPAFYEKMSFLLDEIIALRKAKALDYENLLKRYATLVESVEAGLAPDTPRQLNTPGKRALYNNLLQGKISFSPDRITESPVPYGNVEINAALALTMKIDEAVKRERRDDWRGTETKERALKTALLEVLGDTGEVESIFSLLVQHREY